MPKCDESTGICEVEVCGDCPLARAVYSIIDGTWTWYCGHPLRGMYHEIKLGLSRFDCPLKKRPCVIRIKRDRDPRGRKPRDKEKSNGNDRESDRSVLSYD